MKRPRLLDIYVLKYFVSSYVICFVSFVGFYMVLEAFGRLDDYLQLDRSLGDVFRSYLVRIPEIFHRLAPYLTLAAAGFTVSRLQKNNELAPMKALGVSTYRALVPVFLAAVVLSGFIVLDQEWLIPQAEAARRRLVIRKRKLIRPELISDADRGLVIQMDGYDPVGKRMEDVRVAMFGLDPDNPRVFIREKGAITARTGERDETTDPPRWILRDWKLEEYDDQGEYEMDRDSGKLTGRRSGAEGLVLETDVGPQDIESHDLDIYYLTFSDLNRLYHRQKLPHLRVKLHSRISYPVANLILLFLGLPFFLSDANRSLFIGSGICTLIGFAYFFVSFLFISMGNSGTIPPMTAAWMPSIFFACLGITLFDRVRS